MKRYIFATHHGMAAGMKDTMQFITKTRDPLYDLSAYMDESGDEDLENRIKELFSGFSSEDMVVIMTDMMNGSVNQKFYPYMNDHIFLISGINVPMALALMICPEEMLTKETIRDFIRDSREALVFVNDWEKDESDEDE